MQNWVALCFRVIAAVHGLIGATIALLAAGLFRFTWTHSGSGPTTLLVMGPLVALAIVIGVWFVSLGIRVWLRSRGWASALRWTHVFVSILSAWFMVAGVIAIRGARLSAAHGGGLMGALGYLEFGAGILLAVLAVSSLLLSAVKSQTAPQAAPPASA